MAYNSTTNSLFQGVSPATADQIISGYNPFNSSGSTTGRTTVGQTNAPAPVTGATVANPFQTQAASNPAVRNAAAAAGAASKRITTQTGSNQIRFGTPTGRSPSMLSGEYSEPTSQEIKELEKQTNLTLYPYVFGGELAKIKHQFSDLNINKYYLLLSLLVYGFDNATLRSATQGQDAYVIDEAFIADFLNLPKQPGLLEPLQKTPAWQKGCFDDIGKLGVTEVNADRMENNPITGPEKSTPSLVEKLLNKIHPDTVDNIEKFCNVVRTRSYLSMPKGAFGSISRLVAGINGVIAAFQGIINDIYNGVILYIQKIYAWINGIIVQIQRKLIEVIEDIIPLDLLCLILDTLQVLLDDINFFTSLFNMSGSFTNILNSIQNFVNITSNFVTNPFTTVMAYLPPEVTQIIDTVNQIGTDPGGFLADQLSNYGYAWVATALQGNLIGALVNKFGPGYAAITPLGNVLAKAGDIYQRYGGSFPPIAASLGPNVYNSNREDIYGHPLDPSFIYKNIQDNFRSIGPSVGQIGEGVKKIPGDVNSFITSLNPFDGK